MRIKYLLSLFLLISLILIPLCKSNESLALKDGGTSEYFKYLKGSDGKSYNGIKKLKYYKFFPDGKRELFIRYSKNTKRKHIILNTGDKKEYVYCVEAGAKLKLTPSMKYISKNINSSSFFNSLPKYVREGILLTSIYGYRYGDKPYIKGTNIDDYYYATQIILWEYQQLFRHSPTKLVNNSIGDKNYYFKLIKGRPAEKYYRDILIKMKNHYIMPSFTEKEEYLMKYIGKSTYRLALKDSKNLSGIHMYTKDDELSVGKDNGMYLVKSSGFFKGAKKVLFEKSVPGNRNNVLFWEKGDYQVLLNGSANPIKKPIYVRAEDVGRAIIKKVSADGNISGIKFTIIGNTKEYRVETDKNGMISINLPPGNYKIIEDEINGYEKQPPYDFLIKKGEDTSFEFKNIKKEEILGSINIVKKDGENKKPLKSCVIALFDNQGNKIREGETNDSGEVSFDNLKLGEYFYREIKAPDGYVLNDNKVHFLIDKNTLELNRVILNFKDKRGSLSIIKRDQKTKKALKGAKIGLFDTEGNKVDEKISDNLGEVLFDNLDIGEYYYRELEAPDGYLIDDKQYNILIEDNILKLNRILENKKEFIPQTGDEDMLTKYLLSIFIILFGIILIILTNVKRKEK